MGGTSSNATEPTRKCRAQRLNSGLLRQDQKHISKADVFLVLSRNDVAYGDVKPTEFVVSRRETAPYINDMEQFLNKAT